MSRRMLSQWHAQQFPAVVLPSRPKPAKPEMPPPVRPVLYRLTLPDGDTYFAMAKSVSEARAKLKHDLSLPRLPIGTVVQVASPRAEAV
jgi:hypothetical protein